MPEPPKVHEQGREPQVEANVPAEDTPSREGTRTRDAAARHTGHQTRSGRAIREPSRYRDFRKCKRYLFFVRGRGGFRGRGVRTPPPPPPFPI